MGEEVKISDYDAGRVDDDRVSEWEVGLPSVDDLTPLSQPLVPRELASAFSITPEPYRTNLDVNRASQDTLASLRGQYCSNKFDNFKSFNEGKGMELDGDEADLTREGSDSRKVRRVDAEAAEDSNNTAVAAATTKRPRLVWTPQLHKRFVDVVAHLGIKNAVPKTIMQLMNVEGLTRENVASHLQKYRLYLKRMQGLSNEGPSASDHLFASTPVPQSLHESSGGNGTGNVNSNGNGNGSGHVSVPIPMPYGPQMVPMPVYGYMGMPQPGAYPGFDYNMMQQKDWSGNKFGSVNSYHRITPSD